MSETGSVEDLARDLMLKIRNSNFLEENPPRGNSIFDFDQVSESSESNAIVEQATIESEETVEDIARKIMMQLRTSGISGPNHSSDSSKVIDIGQDDNLCQELEDMLAGNASVEFVTAPVNVPMPHNGEFRRSDQVSKPGFHDAVDFLLGELDRSAQNEPTNCSVRGLSNTVYSPQDDSDDELVEAFRAMANTVDAFKLDLSGQLDVTSVESGCSEGSDFPGAARGEAVAFPIAAGEDNART
jgi:hypothetical protein